MLLLRVIIVPRYIVKPIPRREIGGRRTPDGNKYRDTIYCYRRARRPAGTRSRRSSCAPSDIHLRCRRGSRSSRWVPPCRPTPPRSARDHRYRPTPLCRPQAASIGATIQPRSRHRPGDQRWLPSMTANSPELRPGRARPNSCSRRSRNRRGCRPVRPGGPRGPVRRPLHNVPGRGRDLARQNAPGPGRAERC